MAVDNFFPNPIFDESSVEIYSGPFVINPGEVAIIRAFDFADYADRVDTTTARVSQSACLEMLLFKENPLPLSPGCQGAFLNWNDFVGLPLAVEKVRVGGCAVSISKCHNLLLFNVPGTYRFTMNDDTAVGEARIYIQIISKTEYPWDSHLFI